MRILFLVTGMGRGGAETQVAALAVKYSERGHAVKIVSLISPEVRWENLEAQGISIESLGMRQGRASISALWCGLRLMSDWRPDVVHCHMYHANILGRIMGVFHPRVPIVCTAHNVYEGGWLRMRLYEATDNLALFTTNVSRAAVDRYLRIRAMSASRGYYMPNGVDLSRFSCDREGRDTVRNSLGIRLDEFLWLAVGRIDPAKDYPNLLSALKSLRKTQTGCWRVFIVGGGEGVEQLRELIGREGLSCCVEMLGLRKDVPSLMASADAFVMSSAWEGLPMVLLEAAASGLPIVATNVGGNAEVVIDEQNGFIVPEKNPIALALAMDEVMNMDSAKRLDYGRSGRLMVERNYDLDRVSTRWLKIYNGISS